MKKDDSKNMFTVLGKIVGHPDFVWEVITPEVARAYLDRSGFNRDIDWSVVECYVRLMTEGKWVDRHYEPIAFDTKGFLREGQHRLWAIIKSMKTVVCTVYRDSTEDSFNVANQGKKRSVSDLIDIKSNKMIPNSRQVAASATRMSRGFETNPKKMLSNNEIADFAIVNNDWIQIPVRSFKDTIFNKAALRAGFANALIHENEGDRQKILSAIHSLGSHDYGKDKNLQEFSIKVQKRLVDAAQQHMNIKAETWYAFSLILLESVLKNKRVSFKKRTVTCPYTNTSFNFK